MSFSTLTNFVTMLFCSAVLIQSVRLIRCLRDMRGDAFGEIVTSLDASTIQARAVLADLRETLKTDCAANARVIASGTAMREELTVMAGIADAVAERIVEAVEKSNPRQVAKAVPAAKPNTKAVPKPTAASNAELKPKLKAPAKSGVPSPVTARETAQPIPAKPRKPKATTPPKPVSKPAVMPVTNRRPARRATPAGVAA